ncbi:hypothetical protein RNP65_22515, partial [Escherichia coli]|nr:hypothetical protein [Escherichia coli]
KRAYCLKTQPATGETYPKSDLFNKATKTLNLPEKAIKAECYWNISKTSIPTGFFLVSEFWDINPVNDGVSPKEYVV